MRLQPRDRRARLLPGWAQGVTHAFVEGSPQNLVSGRLITCAGTGVPRKRPAGHHSVGANFQGNAHYWRESLGANISATDNWTYACLVMFPTAATSQAIATFATTIGSASGMDRSLVVNSSGRFGAYIYDGTTKFCNGTTTVAANTLYPVVVTAIGNDLSLYVRGALEATVSIAAKGYNYPSGSMLVLGYMGGDATQVASPGITTSTAIVPLFLRATTIAWDAKQIAVFSRDPYSIFISEEDDWDETSGIASVATFNAGWAVNANTVIQSGARTA